MKLYFHNFLVKLIAKLFSPVKLPEELLQIQSQLAHTILITQSHSFVIEGLLLSFAQRLGLSSANRLKEQALSDIVSNSSASLSPLSWASMHDLAKISWPQALAPQRTIEVRTLNVFQVKGPIRKWPSFKPSRFWLWGLIPTRRILTVTVGEAINFYQFSSQRLLRLIKIDFVRTLKLVRGTPFEPREEQARAILSGWYRLTNRTLCSGQNLMIWSSTKRIRSDLSLGRKRKASGPALPTGQPDSCLETMMPPH